MEPWQLLAVGVLGSLFGYVMSWWKNKSYTEQLIATHEQWQAHYKAQLEQVHTECTALHEEKVKLVHQCGELQAQQVQMRAHWAEKEQWLQDTQVQLSNAFKALCAEALSHNNKSFIDLAQATLQRFHLQAQTDLAQRQSSIQQTLEPLSQHLDTLKVSIDKIENARLQAYGSLYEQMKSVAQAQVQLEQQTSKLTQALSTPHVRGQWGELQLRKTVEAAGMLHRVDFVEQVTQQEGQTLQRPDMVVHLPGEACVIVDAKAPLQAYMQSLQSETNQQREYCLKQHSKHIREHIVRLGSKQYWKQFQTTPEFVVLFVPGEVFFSAALEHDFSLIEFGVEQKVLLASPITLIALLKTIAYGWQQSTLAQEARTITTLGSALYGQIKTMTDHFHDLRRAIEKTVLSYNKTLGAIESKVVPTARQLTELHDLQAEPLPLLSALDSLPNVPRDTDSLGIHAALKGVRQ